MRNIMKFCTGFMLVMLCSVSTAFAAPDVKVSISAEKMITVEENGKTIEKRVAAEDVLPGDVVIYTLSYENKGDEAAQDVVLNDPIPAGTTYIVGSSFSPGASESFSIDKGTNFKKPSLLSYEVEVNGTVVKKTASPEQYTHIRWVVKEIQPGKSGVAGFKVRVN